MKDKIGIIGQGFVGTAVRQGLQGHFHIETYDKFKESTCGSVQTLCEKTKYIFVCLPTPMRSNGSCDLSIVEQTIHEIDKHSDGHVAIIKSTVPPGTTSRLNAECNTLNVVFNPEFLTEANYIDDFKYQTRIIIGGETEHTSLIRNLYKKVFYNTPIIKTDSETAEMVKYFLNCFFATKVSFANEMKDISDSIGIDYDKVVEYSLYDIRIGKSHLSTPGPDGKRGFGGSCFPKDVNAMIYFAIVNDINPVVLKSIWLKNLLVRPEKDWEKLVGRAISEEE
jgi:nucleotide sugar dehydrogenase